MLTSFLNTVIAQGLNEEDENKSYILSVYLNPKKYFSFVELNSIELTTACLELDGIYYHDSALKIQRADEYKPDLLSASSRPPIKLNLSRIPSLSSSLIQNLSDQDFIHPTFRSIVRSFDILEESNYVDVLPGSLVLLGFPYDESDRLVGGRSGTSGGPKVFRKHFLHSDLSITNPEVNFDFSCFSILDFGDVPLGLNVREAYERLSETVLAILVRGGIPIVIGGPSDISYPNASAALHTFGAGSLSVVSIDAYLNVEQKVRPVKPCACTSSSYVSILIC